MVRLLTFSSLYPSSVNPNHGIFVETRLRELLSTGQVNVKVVSPVPWFFSKNPRFGNYAEMARIPQREFYNGIDVRHPRYFLPPKIGMTVAPILMALGAVKEVRSLLDRGFDFDLIDAHYYYPDGAAAALLAKWFRKPFVVTARGTDINLISRYSIPRKIIRWTSTQAHASIAVSGALSEKLEEIGVDSQKLRILRNGVDIERFHPIPRKIARAELMWPDEPTLISVGNLVENKGHHIGIGLIASMPNFRLVIVGSGPEREKLEKLARNLGVSERVIFAGRIAQDFLPMYYSAADILILASSREGWPNVLLESMACGTPVLATDTGGIPEIVTTTSVGRLATERSIAGFLPLIQDLWKNYPDRSYVRQYAETFGWKDTTEAQLSIFQNIASDLKPSSIESSDIASDDCSLLKESGNSEESSKHA